MGEGLAGNLALLRLQKAPFVARLGKADVLDHLANPAAATGGNLLHGPYGFSVADQNNYLRTDWSGAPEAEEQIATIERVILDQVDRHCDSRESVMVLGAGTGRHLYDLADRFDHATGVDSTYAYVDLFHRLRAGPIRFWFINTRSPVSDDTLVREVVACLPPDAAARLGKIDYPVADAAALPLADGSQSAVVAIFFSDVIPLAQLLPEVARVLHPGGKYICYGPLTYQFDDPAAYLSPGEARHVLAMNGFRVEQEARSELLFQAFPDVGMKRIYRIWSYVASRA